jgi:hypothetical protein
MSSWSRLALAALLAPAWACVAQSAPSPVAPPKIASGDVSFTYCDSDRRGYALCLARRPIFGPTAALSAETTFAIAGANGADFLMNGVQLRATFTDAAHAASFDCGNPTWTTSDPDVATLRPTGTSAVEVSGTREGPVTISVACAGRTAELKTARGHAHMTGRMRYSSGQPFVGGVVSLGDFYWPAVETDANGAFSIVVDHTPFLLQTGGPRLYTHGVFQEWNGRAELSAEQIVDPISGLTSGGAGSITDEDRVAFTVPQGFQDGAHLAFLVNFYSTGASPTFGSGYLEQGLTCDGLPVTISKTRNTSPYYDGFDVRVVSSCHYVAILRNRTTAPTLKYQYTLVWR